MKKNILEEIENMKYLLGYKRGVVISEQQQTTYGNEYITGANPSPVNIPQNAQAVTPSLPTTNNQTTQNAANELERQQGDAYKIFKDFQAKIQAPTPSPAAATGTQAASTTTSAPAASTTTTSAPAAPTTTTTTAAATPVTPIKMGVKYPSIEELQNSLNTKNQAGLTPDGKYGPKTAASVLSALQKLPVNSTETKTPDTNIKDQSAETLKKTAEANATANGVTNNQNNNKQSLTVDSNVPEVDFNDYV